MKIPWVKKRIVKIRSWDSKGSREQESFETRKIDTEKRNLFELCIRILDQNLARSIHEMWKSIYLRDERNIYERMLRVFCWLPRSTSNIRHIKLFGNYLIDIMKRIHISKVKSIHIRYMIDKYHNVIKRKKYSKRKYKKISTSNYGLR